MTGTARDGTLRRTQTVFEHVAGREAARAEIDDELRRSWPRLGYHNNNKQLNRVHAWSVNGHQVAVAYRQSSFLSAIHRVLSIAISASLAHLGAKKALGHAAARKH